MTTTRDGFPGDAAPDPERRDNRGADRPRQPSVQPCAGLAAATINIRRTPSSRRAMRTPSRRSYGKTAEASGQGQDGRAGDRRERRSGSDLGEFDALRTSPRSPFWSRKTPTRWRRPTRFRPAPCRAFASRLKMAKTTNVIAIVEAGGKLYSTSKEVKVTVGGCGG